METKSRELKQILNNDSIRYDPASNIDPFGRVFSYNRQIYRTVADEYRSLAQEIIAQAPAWSEHGLIETAEARYQIEGAALVLSHRTLDFRSYCTEWLPEMLKDAALIYLRLQCRLINDGYLLKDGHPWNILFDGTRPVYVDVGSIVPFDNMKLIHALEEFRLYFLLPLRLHRKWGSKKTFEFLNLCIPNDMEREEIAKAIRLEAIHLLRWPGVIYNLKRLIRKIENIRFTDLKLTEWSDYEQKAPNLDHPDKFSDKQRPAYEVLGLVGSGTLLDIGCNKGWYSLLAEKMGFSVVAIDVDLASLTKLYIQAKHGQSNILPLYVDFSSPTGANGKNGAYPAFINRMECDVVLAMAVTHHLVYKARLSFDDISGHIAQLARKIAVVEFIPRDDIYVSEWDQKGKESYTRTNFIESFMRHFDKMESYPSTPLPREVFVFKKAGF